MVVNWLVALYLGTTLWQSQQLGADSYDARTAATTRLASAGPVSLPALAFTYTTGDLEQRKRAAYLFHHNLHALDGRVYDLVAWWTFYGPDQYDGKDGRWARYLHDYRWRPAYRKASYEFYSQLRQRAVKWGLCLPDRDVPLDAAQRLRWIDLLRHRALKLEPPAELLASS